MKSLTCFSSRSRGTCCAVILERLAENCRGRTTAIICTRTNAPKYILESHRLHFGSICNQNGRNFEPCLHLYKRHTKRSIKDHSHNLTTESVWHRLVDNIQTCQPLSLEGQDHWRICASRPQDQQNLCRKNHTRVQAKTLVFDVYHTIKEILSPSKTG